MNIEKAWVIDIESNNLLSESLDYTAFPYKLKKEAKLWCIVLRNVETNEVRFAIKENITKAWMKENLKDCEYLIAHNGIKFDLPLLKLFGVLDYKIGYINESDTVFNQDITIIDSLILSRWSFPDRFGGHSLESWGERVGEAKTNFRKECIDKGIIEKNSPQGAEFQVYSDVMLNYCNQDTLVNSKAFIRLLREFDFEKFQLSIKQENKLADLALNRESLGFKFDKNLAIQCVDDLTIKMQNLADIVNPLLPPKLMNKGELKDYTPPKRQIDKEGNITASMLKFIINTNGLYRQEGNDFYYIDKDGNEFKLPLEDKPIQTHIKAEITDLDHVKMYLIELGWKPTEWRERDLTKDSKKQSIPYEKRIKVLERWVDETIKGKYTIARLEKLGVKQSKLDSWILKVKQDLKKDRPIKVPTSPCVRVGVEKNLCPNLEKLGEQVAFAKDFTLYLTYKSRKSNIAGGDIEDMDFDLESPNTGYLSTYREEDGRIPTPAIEIGATSHRYTHIKVANIPRASSIYGKEMRSLFGCGDGAYQLGFDFSSLEARIMAHYVWNYKGGQELAQMFLAEKPNDWHTVTSIKLELSRTDTKSVNYAAIYGASGKKIAQMLGVSLEKGEEILNGVWDNAPALTELKQYIENFWEKNNYIIGIDGRIIKIRSKHSILNTLFQSAGVICAKYVTVYLMQYLEHNKYCISPFVGKPDVCSMIEYHDENQLYVNEKLLKFKDFNTKEEVEQIINNWKGNQLSTISEINGKFRLYTQNPVSIGIEKAIKQTESFLKLNIPLGFEWVAGKNWYECH